MIRLLIKLLFISTILSLLISCTESNRAFVKANNEVSDVQKNIQQVKLKATSSPAVTSKQGFYTNPKPISIANNPAWLNNRISFRAHELPFSFILQRILRNTDAILSYQPDVQSNKIISMNYSGTIRGALDNLAEKANYAYTINGKQINWSSFITKNFDISFMPGSSDYLVGQSQTGSAVANQRGDTTTVIGELRDKQYSSLKGSLSVWEDLRTTLRDLKSKDGTVEISEATTSVLVHDHPANVRVISQYIKQLNQELSRQVELKVKILDVDLDKSHQYGIDWNWIATVLGTKLNLTSRVVSSTIQSTLGTQAITLPGLRIGENDENFSNVFFQALGTMGKISIVTEPTVMTLNNQVAAIRITTDTSYLEQSETSTTNFTTTTSMTPGVVTSGLMLYILPKIRGNHIYLQISSIISNLRKLDTINNFGGINQEVSPTGTRNQNITTIQIPTLDEKRFNMRSVVDNGNTLIIGGFKQLENRTNETQIFDSTYLGGRGSRHQNMETVILITPTIIEKNG